MWRKYDLKSGEFVVRMQGPPGLVICLMADIKSSAKGDGLLSDDKHENPRILHYDRCVPRYV